MSPTALQRLWKRANSQMTPFLIPEHHRVLDPYRPLVPKQAFQDGGCQLPAHPTSQLGAAAAGSQPIPQEPRRAVENRIRDISLQCFVNRGRSRQTVGSPNEEKRPACGGALEFQRGAGFCADPGVKCSRRAADVTPLYNPLSLACHSA
jgi:hypothetical protein